MSQGDRQDNRQRRMREESGTGVPPVDGVARGQSATDVPPVEGVARGSLPVPRGQAARAAEEGARLWLLPADLNGWWPIGETDPLALSEALAASRASILVPPLDSDHEKQIHQRARDYVLGAFNSRLHETVSALLIRALLASAWLLVALVGLLLGLVPGWAKELDVSLLLLGGAFLLYAIVRYGLAAVRLHQGRVDALQAFRRAGVIPSPLAGRLAKALSLRHTLPPQERGKSPDDELLDTKAYRKLIKEGVTTRAEFCALGRSVAEALQLDSPDRSATGRSSGDLAREAGLDTETAIFYRDLAAAAREISLETEWA